MNKLILKNNEYCSLLNNNNIFMFINGINRIEYVNEMISELCKTLDIKYSVSTAYHHQTLGLVGRGHRILNEYLRSYLNGN